MDHMNIRIGDQFFVASVSSWNAVLIGFLLCTFQSGGSHSHNVHEAQPPHSVNVMGGMAGVLMGIPGADFLLHNTLFLVAHFHTMVIGGALFGIFAIISRRTLQIDPQPSATISFSCR